jgi:outer membrane lipoprotein-sorting protein
MTHLTSFTATTLRRALAGALVLAAPAALIAPAAPAAAANTSAELDQVVGALRAIGTMTADFTQTDRKGQTLRGKLTLKRPGRIRFEYEKSVNMLLVSDGKALTLIDYDVDQVSRWPIGNSPLGVLLNPNRDLSKFAKVIADPADGPMLVQARDAKHPEFGVITIAFRRTPAAPGGLRLDGWTVVDAQNNRSTVRLSDQRFNVAVSNDAFNWTDPRPRKPAGKL